MKKAMVTISLLLGAAGAYAFTRPSRQFGKLVKPSIMRIDDLGKGWYLAPRRHGTHKGVDIVVNPGQAIQSPIDGYISRIAIPYANDSRFSGLEIIGRGSYEGYAIKVFYLRPIHIGQEIRKGDTIGHAQQISIKYSPRMLDHVHIEIRYNGQLLDPWPLIG